MLLLRLFLCRISQRQRRLMLLIAATADAVVDVAAVVVTAAAAPKVDVAALAVPVQHVAIMCLGELYAKQPY